MNATLPPFEPCCSEQEIVQLVHSFYAKVRLDPLLGPIFEQHVADWDPHLAQMVDFWSSLLRGTKRFSGAPLSRHMVLPLEEKLFHRWLELFALTTSEIGNPQMKAIADARAARIADHFWRQYQLNNRVHDNAGNHADNAAG